MKRFLLHLVLLALSFPALAELEVITLQHRDVNDVLPIIRPLLDPDGVASGMNYQLILRTSPRNLEEIKELLRRIDVAPRRLRITVMQNVDGETARRLTEVSGSIGVGRDVRIGVDGEELGRGLSAEARDGADRLRARVYGTRSLEADHKTQQVQVLEGGRALINVGQSLPVTRRQVLRTPGGRRMIEDTEYREVGSGFYVLPRLNGERVTLEISTQDDAPSTDAGHRPSIRTQQIHTTVSGRLGEWMMLGDISRDTRTDTSSISTDALSSAREDRHVLLMVEEIR